MSSPALAFSPVPRLREDSDLRLLRAVHQHGLKHAKGWLDRDFEGMSQSEAASVTGLSKASISTIAKGFRERGLLFDTEGIALEPSLGVACGFDIGFEQIRVAASDLHGHLLDEPKELKVMLGEQPEPSIDWMSMRVEELLDEAAAAGANGGNTVGIGISMTGVVDRATGKLRRSESMGGHWRVLSVKNQLRQRLRQRGTVIVIDRDANASALADALWGVGQGVDSSVFVKWSTAGVSAAVSLDHQIFRGASGAAGEIGHAVVRTKSSDKGCLKNWLQEHPPCRECGTQGCLEAVASMKSLREYVQDETLTVEALLDLARQSTTDENTLEYRARHGLETAARCIGRVIAPVISTLNPNMVILGGKLGARSFPIVGLSLSEGIRDGEITQAIEEVETAGEIHELTGRTSVRGAIALALLDEDPQAEGPSWLKTLARG